MKTEEEVEAGAGECKVTTAATEAAALAAAAAAAWEKREKVFANHEYINRFRF